MKSYTNQYFYRRNLRSWCSVIVNEELLFHNVGNCDEVKYSFVMFILQMRDAFIAVLLWNNRFEYFYCFYFSIYFSVCIAYHLFYYLFSIYIITIYFIYIIIIIFH